MRPATDRVATTGLVCLFLVSLPEFRNFKFFGKTILVVNKKFEFLANQLRKRVVSSWSDLSPVDLLETNRLLHSSGQQIRQLRLLLGGGGKAPHPVLFKVLQPDQRRLLDQYFFRGLLSCSV